MYLGEMKKPNVTGVVLFIKRTGLPKNAGQFYKHIEISFYISPVGSYKIGYVTVPGSLEGPEVPVVWRVTAIGHERCREQRMRSMPPGFARFFILPSLP